MEETRYVEKDRFGLFVMTKEKRTGEKWYMCAKKGQNETLYVQQSERTKQKQKGAVRFGEGEREREREREEIQQKRETERQLKLQKSK
jgi:hypothetical protein